MELENTSAVELSAAAQGGLSKPIFGALANLRGRATFEWRRLFARWYRWRCVRSMHRAQRIGRQPHRAQWLWLNRAQASQIMMSQHARDAFDDRDWDRENHGIE